MMIFTQQTGKNSNHRGLHKVDTYSETVKFSLTDKIKHGIAQYDKKTKIQLVANNDACKIKTHQA